MNIFLKKRFLEEEDGKQKNLTPPPKKKKKKKKKKIIFFGGRGLVDPTILFLVLKRIFFGRGYFSFLGGLGVSNPQRK